MKKLQLNLSMLALVLTGLISNRAAAQKSSDVIMDVGSVTVNIGVGVGNTYSGSYGSGYSGYYGGTGFGGKVAIERGFWQLGPGVLTLGLEAGGSFSNGNLGYGYSTGYKSSIAVFAARSAYHYGWNVPNLDTYAGVAVGAGLRSYDAYDINNDKYKEHKTVAVVGGFIGASYFFSSNIGVNVEVGNDITYAQGGVIFKLK